MARRPRPRSRGLDRQDPDAADPQARRLRDRPVLPARRPDASSRSRSTRSSRRPPSPPGARASRSTCDAPLHDRREAALRRDLPCAPLRRGAPVRRHARLLEARHVDARPGRHDRPARARVHGRGLRLRAADAPTPPPKKPILTILKQARAFGVGLVLSTQNPVDLDYKAISNAGTWLIGRLQTEQRQGATARRAQLRRGRRPTWPRSTGRSAASTSASSCSSPRSRDSRGCSRRGGRCRTSAGR